MNPLVVVPTYWSNSEGQEGTYDHATPLSRPQPELEGCLASLEKVRGVLRVAVLLVAPPVAEEGARARVNAICAAHPNLNPLVIGHPEAQVVRGCVSAMSPGMVGETVSLRGYGAIRNMGLAVGAALGHDVVVFIDDDEVALDPDFLVQACYGLGSLTRQNLPIYAKSGYFIDRNGAALADEKKNRWCDHWWPKRQEFNAWMAPALQGVRISRSNVCCGGCMAVHAEAFSRVPFDPWITRGEDLDYLFDLRLNGMDVWFDNEWHIRHLPPPSAKPVGRFQQDVYRWIYETHKFEVAAKREELRRVTASSLEPYPGEWIGSDLRHRIRRTAFARAIGCEGHGDYLRIFRRGIPEAERYVQETSGNYLAFLTYWQRLIEGLWDDAGLARQLLSMGSPRRVVPVDVEQPIRISTDMRLPKLGMEVPQVWPGPVTEAPTDPSAAGQAGEGAR
jgi:glycosyltransferase involved in cell wall biosynthesis